MKVAIIGSRNLTVDNFDEYVPLQVTEIVSGGARGIDLCAREYAMNRGIPLKEFFPDYQTYGRKAPLLRNLQIIEYADLILAFWDGKSHGTRFVIEQAQKQGKKIRVFRALQ